jgi:hypothetical protein
MHMFLGPPGRCSHYYPRIFCLVQNWGRVAKTLMVLGNDVNPCPLCDTPCIGLFAAGATRAVVDRVLECANLTVLYGNVGANADIDVQC